jgi:hypothetical protein
MRIGIDPASTMEQINKLDLVQVTPEQISASFGSR